MPFATKTDPAPGSGLLLQISAQRALEMGFPSVASDLYQRLLDNPATAPTVRNGLIVDLVTALLDEDRSQEAEVALQKYTGLPSAAYRLRAGLVHVRARRYDQARGELAGVRFDELPPADRSWYYFLQATLADVARDFNRSGGLYQQAIDAAVSEAQRARFMLASEQARLSLGDFSEPLANGQPLRDCFERPGQEGRGAGFVAAPAAGAAAGGADDERRMASAARDHRRCGGWPRPHCARAVARQRLRSDKAARGVAIARACIEDRC
jgi:hypothetical protein